MIVYIIAITFYLSLAAMAKATRDVISFRYSRSVFTKLPEKYQQWTNPQLSWKNKHTNIFITDWILSTALVWITDLWHLAEAFYYFGVVMTGWFAHNLSVALELSLPGEFLLFLALYLIKGAIFEYTFSKALILKEDDYNQKARKLPAEDAKLSNKIKLNPLYVWTNGIIRNIALMGTAFIIILGQLWLFRVIHGGYETIHAYPDSIQWPEVVVITEILIFILSIPGYWILKAVKK